MRWTERAACARGRHLGRHAVSDNAQTCWRLLRRGRPVRVHFHDTRNTGLANAYAAVEAGVQVLDASCGGLGGCPFAPNATGNIGTEDLVYMLERAGFETGYDLGRLIETAQWMAEILGKPPAASVSRAGSFPNA